MKVMIKILQNGNLKAWYYKEFKDVSEIIMHCTSKTNEIFTYDFEVMEANNMEKR